jgi:hypothetical protein
MFQMRILLPSGGEIGVCERAAEDALPGREIFPEELSASELLETLQVRALLERQALEDLARILPLRKPPLAGFIERVDRDRVRWQYRRA